MFTADRIDPSKIAELQAERQAKMQKIGDAVVQSLTEAIVQDPSRLTVVLGDINEWFSTARTLRQLGKHFGQSSTARALGGYRELPHPCRKGSMRQAVPFA